MMKDPTSILEAPSITHKRHLTGWGLVPLAGAICPHHTTGIFFLSFPGSVPQNQRSPRDNDCNGGTS